MNGPTCLGWWWWWYSHVYTFGRFRRRSRWTLLLNSSNRLWWWCTHMNGGRICIGLVIVVASRTCRAAYWNMHYPWNLHDLTRNSSTAVQCVLNTGLPRGRCFWYQLPVAVNCDSMMDAMEMYGMLYPYLPIRSYHPSFVEIIVSSTTSLKFVTSNGTHSEFWISWNPKWFMEVGDVTTGYSFLI